MGACGSQQNGKVSEEQIEAIINKTIEKNNESGGGDKTVVVIKENVQSNDPPHIMYGSGGWLPPAQQIDEWRESVKVTILTNEPIDEKFDIDIVFPKPSIRPLYNLYKGNPIINYLVTTMIEQDQILHPNGITPDGQKQPGAMPPNPIVMFQMMQHLITTGPTFFKGHLVGVPLAGLFTGVNATLAGQSLFRNPAWNKAMTDVLICFGQFLFSPESWPETNNSWLSPDAIKQWGPLDQWVLPSPKAPYWKCWNDFFAREIKRNPYRPTAGATKPYEPWTGTVDNTIITSPNDGAPFRWRDGIKLSDTFWLKDMPYSITDILGTKYANYAKAFVGGKIFQTFLDPYNYHRWWSPVSGIVKVRDTLPGLYFSKLVVPDIDGATTASCPYLMQVNARGIVIIDTAGFADIGYVCVVPIGMVEVSSIAYNDKIRINGPIVKGQELGNFYFGGSSFAIMFENAAKYRKQLTFRTDKGHPLPVQPPNNPHLFPRNAPPPSPGGSSMTVKAGEQFGIITSLTAQSP